MCIADIKVLPDATGNKFVNIYKWNAINTYNDNYIHRYSFRSQFNCVKTSISSWKLKYWANIFESLLSCIAELAWNEGIFRFLNKIEAQSAGDKETPKQALALGVSPKPWKSLNICFGGVMQYGWVQWGAPHKTSILQRALFSSGRKIKINKPADSQEESKGNQPAQCWFSVDKKKKIPLWLFINQNRSWHRSWSIFTQLAWFEKHQTIFNVKWFWWGNGSR